MYKTKSSGKHGGQKSTFQNISYPLLHFFLLFGLTRWQNVFCWVTEGLAAQGHSDCFFSSQQLLFGWQWWQDHHFHDQTGGSVDRHLVFRRDEGPLSVYAANFLLNLEGFRSFTWCQIRIAFKITNAFYGSFFFKIKPSKKKYLFSKSCFVGDTIWSFCMVWTL